jgi:hypothetical protein
MFRKVQHGHDFNGQNRTRKVLVGKSSRGRKGTAEGRVRQLMQYVDEDWVRDRKQSGLSSGEGLIWAARDPIKRIVEGQEETLEPG